MERTTKEPKQSRMTDTKILRCLGCGTMGVSICARCAKSKGRILTARAHPLKERDPELYKRLDDLSQRPLEGNKQLWDEFCVEIGAQQYYGSMTFTSWVETGKCRSLLYALQHDRAAFDAELSKAMSQLQQPVASLKLDQDESEVLAVMVLLWAVGSRTYLRYLGEAHRKRIRNAWDRFDRRMKKPQFRKL